VFEVSSGLGGQGGERTGVLSPSARRRVGGWASLAALDHTLRARRPAGLSERACSRGSREDGWAGGLRCARPHPMNYELSMIIPFLQVDARLVAVSARAEDGASSSTRHTLQPSECRRATVHYWTNA
jgi:hypothetical protein